MPKSDLSHPIRIDAATWLRAQGGTGAGCMIATSQFPDNFRIMSVSPVVFTHAYQLLGEKPQRFGDDLGLYLSTVRTFFERADISGGVDLTGFGNSDSRRRISEDMGVAYASLFMINVFAVTWDTIAQIPQNNKLSAKRPDFEGFANAAERFLFEAKGTTALKSIENAMSAAIGQVKSYPEHANCKFAFVTYLCSDSRYFPTASFVVDPPVSLPDSVPADQRTARLLHVEKALQFGGLPETAKAYMNALSRQLIEEGTASSRGEVFNPSKRLSGLSGEIKNANDKDIAQANIGVHIRGNVEFVGQTIRIGNTGLEVFDGVARDIVNAALELELSATVFETSETEVDGGFVSTLSDGTIFQITVPKAGG